MKNKKGLRRNAARDAPYVKKLEEAVKLVVDCGSKAGITLNETQRKTVVAHALEVNANGYASQSLTPRPSSLALALTLASHTHTLEGLAAGSGSAYGLGCGWRWPLRSPQPPLSEDCDGDGGLVARTCECKFRGSSGGSGGPARGGSLRSLGSGVVGGSLRSH